MKDFHKDEVGDMILNYGGDMFHVLGASYRQGWLSRFSAVMERLTGRGILVRHKSSAGSYEEMVTKERALLNRIENVTSKDGGASWKLL